MCSTVSYTRQIPAGGEGKIYLKVNTTGYGGRRLSKSISVETNDKRRPKASLIITGRVDRFYTLSPYMVKLEGAVGEQIKRTITIAANEKYPFKIIKDRAKVGKNIRYELKEVKKTGGKKYLLTVENLKKQKGRYYDIIYLKTNKRPLPEIVIRVQGNIADIEPKSNKQK